MQPQPSGSKALKLLRREGNNVSAKAFTKMARPRKQTTKESALDWVKRDNRRIFHVVYRVGDLGTTVKFYKECLGVKLLGTRDNPEEKYTNVFLGYGAEDSHFVIELKFSTPSYNLQFTIGKLYMLVEIAIYV
ncbi:putative lactoylglutathione lyase, chloroplast [Artemisia annua]|uniref:Putative lactoylglutathione lyase, chloroplast n=1 Tax=Artemisia annua TaxID=35608 RepID=A0A2U1KN67_ARTAN|nr:putative lactoylglutathione lyase, chloroplast [Artemisia annua]